MRRVLYISGSRADYGPARRLLRRLQSHPDLSIAVLVCGMHLDPVHGETWREITADGLDIAGRIPGCRTDDSPRSMAASLGLYLTGMAEAMADQRPDIVLVLGDRGEQLAGAMAAAFQNILVVHLCGGSSSGSVDDSIRHAITKFAHYHLPAFEEHARRIVQMGEDPSTVRVVGLPGGDLRPDVTRSRDEICEAYGLSPDHPYLLVVQHPVTHAFDDARAQIVETLEGVRASGLPALLANPNDDAGGRAILQEMQSYAARWPQFKILPPGRSREGFASVMAHAAALVGNSSSGVVEAMSVVVPVVNVGNRQRGREHLACWLNVAHDREQIRHAIDAALNDEAYRQRLRAHATCLNRLQTEELVADCLRSADLHRARREKVFWSTQTDSAAGSRRS